MDLVLKELIDIIIEERKILNPMWEEEQSYANINYRKKFIKDIENEDIIWQSIVGYQRFLREHQFELLTDISELQNNAYRINARIKQLNSIQYKYNKYLNGDLHGESSINKCFNDLFGVRIIVKNKVIFDDIKKEVNQLYPKMKIINASKAEYRAIHIYFQENNFVFPWELQIWEKSKEQSNLISHNNYKQDYVRWENELKNREV